METLLSTRSVGEKERFAFWREAVCHSYVQLDCACDDPDRFDGEIVLNRLSRLSTSFVRGSQQQVRRRRQDIAHASDESFLVSLQMRQHGIVRQSGREAHLLPGDFALYSSTDRYTLDLPDNFRQFVIQVPRQDLISRLPNADRLTGIRVPGDSPIGGVIGDSILRLIKTINPSNEAVRQSAQDAIIDLIVTGLASLAGAQHQLSQPEQQTLLRADALIAANLRDPDFDRTALALATGFSVRRLSEIYQMQGRSIAATIRKMRLDRIATDITDPRFARQSIGEIAGKWGILDPQKLARNFKTEYGVSPLSYRKNGPKPRRQ